MARKQISEEQLTWIVGQELVNQCLNLNQLAELDPNLAISMIQERLAQDNAIAHYIVHSPTVEFIFNEQMKHIITLLREENTNGTHH